MSGQPNILVIQRIRTIWTKASRGGAGARARNAAPNAFPLPLAQPRGIRPVIEHDVTFLESNHFSDPIQAITTSDSQDSLTYDCLLVTLGISSVKLFWEYRSDDAGAPPRHPAPKELFTLQVGQWGRIEYNGRFSRDRGWSYKKTVVNVGL